MLKALSIVGYFGMVGGFLGLLAAGRLLSPYPLVIAAQAAALLLFLLARLTLGWRSFHLAASPTEGGLVTSGPYRQIRHPIYAAFCLFAGAGIAAHGSWAVGACGGLILGSALLRMFCEETLVAARYPGYAEYAAKTRRMIPFVF
jgi:protein-S-isoprenylcysteine O-methyltransferase Ste14